MIVKETNLLLFHFYMTGIFLSGFKLSAKEIDEKLSVFREEDGALPMDHVIALKRLRWLDPLLCYEGVGIGSKVDAL